MPIYEYECQACDQVHEVTQRISDDPLTTCPDCQGSLKKLVSRSAFHLKGGGWYADGYGNGSASNSTSCSKSTTCPATPAATPSKETTPVTSSVKSPCGKSGECCAAQTSSG